MEKSRPRPSVPPADQKPIERLIAIMRILRSEDGCPWDREQTLEKLKEHLIEESYEVLDAIDGGDRRKLCEELGDLLLQIVFQAQICAEDKQFTFDDVAGSIVEKLIRRHPHVFGDVKVSGSGEVLKNWEEIKRSEKSDPPSQGSSGVAGPPSPGGSGAASKPRSTVEGIPRHLPALHKAGLIQKRVSRVGFDWDNVEGALTKLEEEVAEIRQAIAAGKDAQIREEIGDVLFAAVNVSRFFGQNAEELLEKTIAKFTRRFQAIEDEVHTQGRKLTDCSLDELDRIWQSVKSRE